MKFGWFAFLLILASSVCFSQQSAPAPVQSGVDTEFVQKEFGATCSLVGDSAPVTGDLNGDGVEDIVIIARCTNPLIDEAEHSFKVVDPYNAFFGYGNPKVTSQFASEDPASRGMVLLVIHGEGSEAWRGGQAKAKFVIINLPFRQVSVRKLLVKKKPVLAIYAEEGGGSQQNSAIFWDGKKYKYQPMGSSMD